MKIVFSALLAAFIAAPLALAADSGKCEKGKCGKEKKEETIA
jgi:hypothetical protein